METNARVVVIGGGIAGCSVLYHLAKLGWTDAVLLEKGELTSGTTWHSVGNVPIFSNSLNVLRLLKCSVELYRSLDGETGQNIGYREVGSLRLATTSDLLDAYRAVADIAELAGVPCHMITPRETVELNPLISDRDLLGAAYVPEDGYLDPTGVTLALARGARQHGAEIYRNTRVDAIHRARNGEWEVVTDKGPITTEIVVNAAGQWANEISQMVGTQLPLVALEHQYVVTGPLSEVQRLRREIPVTRDAERSFYLRQEGEGLLIGFYETEPKPWCVDRVPWEFNQQLLPADSRRIEGYMLRAIERLPVLEDAGIKRIVNGPDAFTPDGTCLMGFVPGMENFFVLAGFSSMGIAFGGGAGKYSAEWIVEGRASLDITEFDVLRFGGYAAVKPYVVEKTCEQYGMHYAVHYPHEERVAARPLKTTPLYDDLKEQGAVYGVRNGWERPLWFAPQGVRPVDELSFHRPNWFAHVGAECHAVRRQVGVLDQSSFGKIEISGLGAAAFLDHLCANKLPELGRIAVTQMLNERGGIESDCTVSRVGEHRYWLITAAAQVTHDLAWLHRHLPSGGSVALHDITHEYGCLGVMGPRSRDLLQKVCDGELSNAAFPFLACMDIHVGVAPVRAYRISYVGELGWELYHPLVYQRHIYRRLRDAGREFGIVNYGYRAQESLRMEKGYRLWGVDMTSFNTPFEAGLDRLVRLEKGDFIGCVALRRQQQEGVTKTLACLTVEGNEPIPHGWEPVLNDDQIIGYVTSAEFGHVVDKTIAFAYVTAKFGAPGTTLSVKILGERYPAVVVSTPFYDPQNLKMRQ